VERDIEFEKDLLEKTEEEPAKKKHMTDLFHEMEDITGIYGQIGN
jgi:hypothetical protein